MRAAFHRNMLMCRPVFVCDQHRNQESPFGNVSQFDHSVLSNMRPVRSVVLVFFLSFIISSHSFPLYFPKFCDRLGILPQIV